MNTSQTAGTPRTWFTSDTHFGHTNIIKYCPVSRGHFSGTDEMDETIIRNWNSVVAPEDTVYHLGDIALGPIDKSLAKISRLNGYKIAILGNHDRPFMRMGKADEGDWWDRYESVFQEVYSWDGITIAAGGRAFVLSHFPFIGDHTPTDRHSDARPVDTGMPLVHGHTHAQDRVTFSKNGTPQIHVGQDAWNMTPVALETIIELLDKAVVV